MAFLRICACIMIPILTLAACRDGGGTPPPQPVSEYERMRGADVARARELYAGGRRAEGAAILRSLAAHEDWDVRSNALRVIGEVRDRELLPVLHAALRDPRLEVRESASRVLMNWGDPSSSSALRVALADVEGIVRSHAAVGLLKIGEAADLEAVRSLVVNDPDPGARAEIVRSLTELRNPALFDLARTAMKDPNAVVRGEAIDALAATDALRARQLLQDAAAHDSDAAVRERARLALQRLGVAPEGVP